MRLDPGALIELAVAIALIALGAVMTTAASASRASSQVRLERLEALGNSRARKLLRLLATPERTIGGLRLGAIAALATAATLTTVALADNLVGWSRPAALLAGAFLVALTGGTLPRAFGEARAERAALRLVPVISAAAMILGPLSETAGRMVRALLRAVGAEARDEKLLGPGRSDLMATLALDAGIAKADREEKEMLGRVLELDDVTLQTVMVHRSKIFMIGLDEPPPTIVKAVLESPYTRIPVWQGEPENIVGSFHVRDVLKALHAVGGDARRLDLKQLLSPPWFVPDSTSLLEQLDAFRRRRRHIALVVDEYGALQGLVTLEDILEEIVGDIRDEHETAVAGVRPQLDGAFVVDGWVAIRDLNRELDWRLPEGTVTTIAGLVIHEAQTLPDVGQVFAFHGFKFEIMRRQRNQITALRIRPFKTA